MRAYPYYGLINIRNTMIRVFYYKHSYQKNKYLTICVEKNTFLKSIYWNKIVKSKN